MTFARVNATIAVIPGDGIGKEVTAVARRILQTVRADLDFVEAEAGAGPLERGGNAYPAATKALCERSAAVLFGAVGDPRLDAGPVGKRPADAILGLRKDFDLFANLRPVRTIEGLESSSTLKPEVIAGLDLVIVRETTSGLYFGTPRETRFENGTEMAVDTMIYRRPEIERVARVAFELARTRRNHVTSVDKQNVLATSVLWRRVVTEVHQQEYADVTLAHLIVDNAAMQLLRQPKGFDVILTENTFGDILSDEAAMLTGSVGNLPSATLGGTLDGRPRFGLYEPISGTAPDIAGQGIANPIASILSAALLCRYSLADELSATRIEHAVHAAIAAGARTRDLATAGSPYLSTDAFGTQVLECLPGDRGPMANARRR